MNSSQYSLKRLLVVVAALALAAIACNLQIGVPTPTEAVTSTATSSPVPTVGVTFVPTATITPTPTDTGTPTVTPLPSATGTATNTPLPSATPLPMAANTCDTCQPFFRTSPGTEGKIVGKLDKSTALTILGRTADGTWAEVVLADGKHGWVSSHFINFAGQDVMKVPVTGTQVDATITATYAIGAPQVVTGITGHSRQIFQAGQKLGNKANVLTRVGDSITASPYFLTPFGSGSYDLGGYTAQLSDVISYFSGSFGLGSIAAGNGWGADRILQPGFSNPGACGNQTPLDCEYNRTKPAVALIMIGTNDAGGVDPAVFTANLDRIVQISIDHGVIPVLSTLPPKHVDAWNNNRIDQFNDIIRLTSRQYDIPLIDYWFALQKVPNQGISSDGVHPSYPSDGATGNLNSDHLIYGYNVRNLCALQMLDALWHSVLY